jgi:hypothetical protein
MFSYGDNTREKLAAEDRDIERDQRIENVRRFCPPPDKRMMRVDELQAELIQTLRSIGPTSRADVFADLAARRQWGVLPEFTDEQIELAWSTLLHSGRVQLTDGAFEVVPVAMIASEAEQQLLLFGG